MIGVCEQEGRAMGRPSLFSAGTKSRIVLSVLTGEISVAEAARKEKVSEESIGRWKAEFLEAGKHGPGPASP